MNCRTPKYVWPASALTESDMALLHAVRETSSPKLPITGLIAVAVRTVYGQAPVPTPPETPPEPRDKKKDIQ